jgi:hypothetical protein
MKRAVLALIAVVSVGALASVQAASSASGPPTAWDGVNPFACVLQQAGFGPTGPHPEADPYCVDFDKRHQSVADLGVVDFLSKEPARVAAASDKCFYFQSDHWRASLIQDEPSTKLYEWDGHYFFDKATGDGGVWVTNFNVNGQTYDPGSLPGMPPQYAKFFGPGTGGFVTHNSFPADPNCVAKAQQHAKDVYATSPQRRGCFAPGGRMTPGRLGPVALGDRERRVREVLGAPLSIRRGFLRYCVVGGARYLVGEPSQRSGDSADDAQPATMLWTETLAYRLRGVGVGTRERTLRRRLPRAVVRLRIGSTRVYATSRRANQLLGVWHGRVRYLAVYDRRQIATARALRAYLLRVGPP